MVESLKAMTEGDFRTMKGGVDLNGDYARRSASSALALVVEVLRFPKSQRSMRLSDRQFDRAVSLVTISAA